MRHADYVVVYHGTSDKYLASIERYGLIPGKGVGSDAWAQHHGLSVGFRTNERPRSVYVSTNKHFAAQFAHYVAEEIGGLPIVVELHVPKQAWASFVEDEQSDPTNGVQENWRREQALPHTWIASTLNVELDATQRLMQRLHVI